MLTRCRTLSVSWLGHADSTLEKWSILSCIRNIDLGYDEGILKIFRLHSEVWHALRQLQKKQCRPFFRQIICCKHVVIDGWMSTWKLQKDNIHVYVIDKLRKLVISDDCSDLMPLADDRAEWRRWLNSNPAVSCIDVYNCFFSITLFFIS